MKKYLFAFSLLMIFITGCKKDIEQPSGNTDLLSFAFQSNTNRSLTTANSISCAISDTLITGITGVMGERTTLIATFTTNGGTLAVNGVNQVSGVTQNDFTNPVIYTLTAADGHQKQYTVKLASFTGLPVFYLSTEAPVDSKDVYVNGTLKVDGNLQFTDGLYNGNIQIKGRGNSTWYGDKKPYKIKLDKKSGMLGMPADKEWALLANYYDKSLLRNDVAFELSTRLGLAWTPRRRFVELVLNGEYQGNYLLTETVKVSTDRLNISQSDAANSNDTSGGFLVENDAKRDGDYWFDTPIGLPFVVKSPETISTVQLNYINGYVSGIEGILRNKKYSDPQFQDNIDADSFINWFLVNELMRNRDAIMYSSVYFYKDKGGKISMGPVWDFDLSSGGYTGNDPEGWYVKDSYWIGWPFDNDIAYRQKVKARWNSVKTDKIATILSYIDGIKNNLQYSQVENFKRWDIMNMSVYDGSIIMGSYDNEVASLRSFLDRRITWMDTEINNW
ncbi:MAG: CotH kinase family protein [Chitinophagaceae bacterium]